MDVKRGLCWRCEKSLPIKKELCDLCKIAVYCSTQCLERDEARHGSVECRMWSPINKCDACGRIGRMKECAGCYSARFCDKTCQTYGWKTHQKTCDKWKEKTLAVAEKRKLVRLKDSPLLPDVLDYPYYFGNTMAVDLLNLSSDPEIPCEEGEENAMSQDFNLLLAGCGDLRNVTQTIYDLPEAYVGKLRFLLNDVDPFVMARNVLLLYMMAVRIDDISIATIWLSSRLSRKCFSHLQSSLAALIASDSKTLKDLTNGAVLLDDATIAVLEQVWEGWKKLRCTIGAKDSINLDEQRSALFKNNFGFVTGIGSYLQEVECKYLSSIKQWIKDGIVVSLEQQKGNLLFYNPTLTGRPPTKVKSIEVRSPQDFKFQYCVPSDSFPFCTWDSISMMKGQSSSSITTLLHLFVTKLTRKTMDLLQSQRVLFEINIDNFVKLRSKLPTSRSNFDRIYTSNLADHYSMVCVLKNLGPLLNRNNQNATLFVGFMNWIGVTDGAIDSLEDKGIYNSRVLSAMKDLQVSSVASVQQRGDCYSQEYNYNVLHFICYLRGEQLGVSENFQSRKRGSGQTLNIPKWSEVTSNYGLRMRDFRKQPNKIVPFYNRVNARVVTLQRGFDRFLEWYRPKDP